MLAIPKKALISVSDKTALIDLAKALHRHGIELYATSGSRNEIIAHKIPCEDASILAKSPEILDGRVKTLSSNLFASILCDRDKPEHLKHMREMCQPLIDLVVVNLYPFEDFSKIKNFQDGLQEWIDIGGVSLLRASAKNFKHVTTLSSPSQYGQLIEELNQSSSISLETRKQLAKAAFKLTAEYDLAISDQWERELPENELSYGENPHQRARLEGVDLPWKILKGEKFSYNSYADAFAALESLRDLQTCAHDFFGDLKATTIIKHQLPCGFALGRHGEEALSEARKMDPMSAYGGIVACNFEIDETEANYLKKYFWEMILAPKFSVRALEILSVKDKTRLLQCQLDHHSLYGQEGKILGKGITLWQDKDLYQRESWELQTGVWESKDQALFHLSLAAVKNLKSNAVVIAAYDDAGLPRIFGMGAGRPNRLQAFTHLALPQALENPNFKPAQAMLISEAFMPFADLIEQCHQAGICKIVAPKGSIRDESVIAKAKELNVALAFTEKRHFKH